MNKPVWTSAQRAAIEARKGNFLVSAGAGSGKTAVLTERVYELVAQGEAKLSELLVLTFTNKAAHEMKEKTRIAFAKEAATSALAPEVEAADIMTFDAFALALVRKYHYELGVGSDVAIADESIFEIEKKKILEGILDRYYASGDPLFDDFIYHYAIKDDDAIKDFILRADALGDLQTDKEAYFADYDAAHFSDDFIERGLAQLFALIRERLVLIDSAAAGYESAAQAEAVSSFIAPFLLEPDYDALRARLTVSSFPRKIVDRECKSEADGKLHKELRELFGKAKETAALGEASQIKGRYAETKKYVDLVVRIVGELNSSLAAFKKRSDTYTFADIASLARAAARQPAIRAELKARYKYIMVDEYQDTSDLQQSFLDLFADGNLFMVGDIKQSIYRFRNANPDIFAEKFLAYRRHRGGELIVLPENFRSRKEVLADLNQLFEAVMSQKVGGVDYRDPAQKLVYGNKAYEATSSPERHLSVYSYRRDENAAAGEEEADIIASDILAKINEGYPLLDGKAGSSRPCAWGDFAILIDRKKDFGVYRRVFAAAKIPLEVSDRPDASTQEVTLTLENLARLVVALDDDQDGEKRAYAALMRSYLYQAKDREIYKTLSDGSYRQSELFRALRAEKGRLLSLPLPEAVASLVREFRFIERLPTIGSVVANYEKLEGFLRLSASMGRLGFSFADFAQYFADLDKYEVSLALAGSSLEGSSVRLMSIHASKGLEFPVVYCPGLDSRFSLADSSGAFLCSKRYGLILPLVDDLEARNLFHVLARDEESGADVSERMRLLYVALTRAEEKIVLVEPIREKNPPLSLSRSSSFRDFLDFYGFPGVIPTMRKATPPPASSATEQAQAPLSLSFREIEIAPVYEAAARASKQGGLPDEAALRYGERLHRLLELSDFRGKDVSWIADHGERALVEKVLALPLFADLGSADVFHEYAFYDKAKDLHGIIDLLIVWPDRLALVDFKSKDIADPAYLSQLAAYAAYCERVYGRKCEKYLLSITEGALKAV